MNLNKTKIMSKGELHITKDIHVFDMVKEYLGRLIRLHKDNRTTALMPWTAYGKPEHKLKDNNVPINLNKIVRGAYERTARGPKKDAWTTSKRLRDETGTRLLKIKMCGKL